MLSLCKQINFFSRFKNLLAENTEAIVKESLIKTLKRYTFFSEEVGLSDTLKQTENLLQKEIMDNYSSIISETLRKVLRLLYNLY